ncbi:MAG: rhodanese-like domain-containing protein [Patescibacteria group bacterium]
MSYESEGEQQLGPRKQSLITRTAKFLISIFILLVIIFLIMIIRISPVGNNPPPVYTVEIEEFAAALESASVPVINDIRGEHLFNESHIPHAIWNGVRDDCTMYGVPLCQKPKCEFSQQFFFYSDHGEEYNEIRKAVEREINDTCWSEVYLLDGGFEAWQEAGLDIES